MKPHLNLRTVCLGLVLLLVVVMCSQVEFRVPLGKARLPVTLADVVLGLAFIGAVLRVVSRRFRGLRLPPLQAFAFVAVALVVLARTEPLSLDAIKEPLQIVVYFLVALFVFLNVVETQDLRWLLVAFAAATAGVIAWAGVHYFVVASPLEVKGTYANRNALGAFLAMALPMLYGLALHVRRWRWRVVLLAIVVAGLAVNLSGGAVLVTLVVLGILSALRGQRAMVPYGIFLGLALLFAPRVLPRPHHTDVLFSSVAVEVDDNYLLSDRQMAERARELFRPTRRVPADKSGELIVPEPRPLDARRLLTLLFERPGHQVSEDKGALFAEIGEAIGTSLDPRAIASYPLDTPQLAVRYQRWNAAVGCVRALFRKPMDALFGHGFVPYQQPIKTFPPMNRRLQYRTDEPEVFNVAAPEPFTFNQWLMTFVLTGLAGLLGLAWLVGTFLHRADKLYREARSELALGVALGALGSILGFALVSLFTETLVRGLALPFVFVLAAVAVAERIVHGDGRGAFAQVTRYD
ncbi:MAG: O-antigen ligase family protein [Planctomycetota bacterium]